ncbi:uncharacterized protein FOMMEDRAFT_130316 [Fomitiporia mediterranea MF3/22]|uniref:GRIP domain-containing protein n=1 Tax=Fomitiporia mediterranea (strain MF3/22) TaxID=694068 RepID=R7SJ47_FOMME|nr:uncharacterized protein FOMMEDRAFT_130316 [Fomitiporia mediterranea MF3/22]EJC97644.1 hypothetical protein FOMMEDRAFT_130316 [Fomitiporia mediterranea MF3/22]
MRTALGNKLREESEELDRRQQIIDQLTAQNEDLTATVETLQNEIVTSNSEAERASKELEAMRSRAYEESSQEALVRERELRELQVELERCRMERDEWEREAQEGRVTVDEAKTAAENYKRDLEIEREARQKEYEELEVERERSMNLQSVLEDFQNTKDHELRQAVRDRDTQLNQLTQTLAEYKHRAHTAELQLEETSTNTTRTVELEKEVKEKELLIRKFRHEAVILNEHLTEALRRLRKNQADNNVDRRLVTNVLLQFLTTPRADSKRFEMLGLLATILSWGDAEREKAGLQRAGLAGSSALQRPSSSAAGSSKGKGSAELDTSDETESFSQRWVEFLLKESSGGAFGPEATSSISQGSLHSSSTSVTPSRSNPSLPSLPGSPRSGATSPGAGSRTLRLASFTSSAMASSPNLTGAASSSRDER